MSKGEYRPPVPFLLRGDAAETRDRATRRGPKTHERETAGALGGRVTPASGALGWAKGDVDGVRAGHVELLVECKRSEGPGLRVEVKWLDKVTREAHQRPGREPALALRLEATTLAEKDWVAVPRSLFERLLAAVREDADG